MKKILIFAITLPLASCVTSEHKFNAVDKESNAVIAPVCPDWSKPSGINYGNNKSSNFGCATTTNYGTMVEDKRDLVVGKSGKTDGATAARAVNNYKNSAVAAPSTGE